jgi:hypothetical protein
MADSSKAHPAMAPGRGRRRLMTVVAAVLAVVGVFYVETALLDLHLATPVVGGQASTPVTVNSASAAALVAGVLAWALIAVFDRTARRVSRPLWTVIAILAFLVSLAGPFGGTGIDTKHRLALAAMHLVVAAILIPLIPDWPPKSVRARVATG